MTATAAMRQRQEQTEASETWSRSELGLSDAQAKGLQRMLAEEREVYLEPDQPHREPPPVGIERIHKDVIHKHEAEIVNVD